MTLVSIPANPVPDNVVSGTIKTPDGAELRFARWQPPANRKGTVCVFTGRGESIEKYFETVRERLKPGKKATLQIITIDDRRFDMYRKGELKQVLAEAGATA